MGTIGKITAAGLAAFALLATMACQNALQANDNSIPETKLADWKVLRNAVQEYESCRADADQRSLMIIQNTFRGLTERNSHNRIGDEALYYTGRIYYDIRDYHDARQTFLRHREHFPSSEFGPTVARLESEMEKDTARYQEWLEQSSSTGSGR